MRKKLKIMYTNADQLTKKKKRELDELVSTEEPHIIAICEVKPKKWGSSVDTSSSSSVD